MHPSVLKPSLISPSPLPSLHRHKIRPPFIVSAASATAEKQRSVTYSYLPNGTAYEILGISAGATGQEIKTAYRRLARTCHPDVAAVDRKDTSADEFMKIHAAYSTLSDPAKRAVYDLKIMRSRRSRPLTSSGRFSGYCGRKWETDQCW